MDPLSVTCQRYWVSNVRYVRHRKKDRPDSLKVIYEVFPEGTECTVFSSRCFYEWVCFEHLGIPSMKARSWALLRGVSPAPKNVDEALACTFAVPKSITVRMGGKFPEVMHHEF